MSFLEDYLKINVTDTHLNFIFHALILFTFLTIFYFMYIVKLTKSVFKNEISEISEIMEKSIANEIEEIKKDKNLGALLSLLSLDDIQKEYSNENKTVSAHNNGIKNVVLTVNILLWIFLVTTIIILKKKCENGCDTHIVHILFENALIFVLIGSIEFLFFKFIASKYIPVPPSFMTTYFLENIQKKL